MPTFWLGILLILLFAVELRWLPSASAYVPFWESPLQALRNVFLPALTLGVYVSGIFARFLRASLVGELKADYVRTARSKGLRERDVVGRHVLRNALLPFVTIVGLMMANFIGGTVVTEAVFTYPGLGRLLIQAISTRDYPLIQGCILVILVIYVGINVWSTCSTPISTRASSTPDATDGYPARPPCAPAALFDLTGQVALVTGASRGLGWAMAQALAAAGATVVLNGRDAATLEPRREALERWGFAAEIAAFDVADGPAAAAAVEAIARASRPPRHPRSAMPRRTCRKPLLEQTDADWQGVIDADLTAGWRLAREAARIMIPAGYGRMIFISSIMGFVARPA